MLDFSAMVKLGEKLNTLVENYDLRTQRIESQLLDLKSALFCINSKVDSALTILKERHDD